MFYNHLMIYLISDIAFVPIEVLLVTLIIHRLLSEREKKSMLNKMNMVIGAFFSEVGTSLIRSCSEFDPVAGEIRNDFMVTNIWSKDDFAKLSGHYTDFEHQIEIGRGDLVGLREFLIQKRVFLLGLLENPNLLEHESFTECLWAVFHLAEELSNRNQVSRLIDADEKHLANDIKRAYNLLIVEWLAYLNHLRVEYPYLFSLAVRLNPFNPDACAVIS